MFVEEILDKQILDSGDFCRPRIELLGRSAVVIEGHRGMCFFSETEIKFSVKSGVLCVCGDSLAVKALTATEAVVCGSIISLSYA
jgi:sporulation protein YqfC